MLDMSWLSFLFSRKERISSDTVDLEEERHGKPNFYDAFESYVYGIYMHGTSVRIGECDLRIGQSEELYYAGNIGYNIQSKYRGHHYAYQATVLLLKKAKELGMKELYITCSPENEASVKTIQRLGAQYKETVNVPQNHWLYRRGEKIKMIFYYSLSNSV